MKKIVIILLCAVLSSCFAFDSESEQVVGDIYLFCLDGNKTLSRKDDTGGYSYLVRDEVYAIWNNDSIVIVKHHPLKGEYMGYDKYDPDYHIILTDITDYYIVFIDKECDERGLYNDSVIGPLDSMMLKQSIKELGMKEENIKFRDVKL